MVTFLIWFGIVVLIGLFITSVYIIRNLLNKIDIYESAINEFYSRTSIVLHAMRSIDERKMFESDDEVGDIFDQLVDIIGTLRPLLYGDLNEDSETEEE